MIAVDTNILVRFFVKDDPEQAEKVYRLFKNAEIKKDKIHVPVLVLMELLWVLDSVYEVPREDILNAIDQLTLMPVFEVEHLPAVQMFIRNAKTNHYDLSDLLIAYVSQTNHCDALLTFDKKSSRHALFKRLQ